MLENTNKVIEQLLNGTTFKSLFSLLSLSAGLIISIIGFIKSTGPIAFGLFMISIVCIIAICYVYDN